ncbi:MAG: hypothetical protein MJE77_04530 [Proteobacteria bacterium]|nr:hypothetical protein [Pseudomonadota bacterium]
MKKKRTRERGYTNLELINQAVAEVPYQPAGSDKTYRLVIRRQLIEESKPQTSLGPAFCFRYRYRYVVTDLPAQLVSTKRVIDLTYERCDQENVIK